MKKREYFVVACVLSLAIVAGALGSARALAVANVKEPQDIVAVVSETHEAETDTVNIVASDVDDVKSESSQVSMSDKDSTIYWGEDEVGDIALAETDAKIAEVEQSKTAESSAHVRTHPITGETITKEQD